jgi:hypothetical protein
MRKYDRGDHPLAPLAASFVPLANTFKQFASIVDTGTYPASPNMLEESEREKDSCRTALVVVVCGRDFQTPPRALFA